MKTALVSHKEVKGVIVAKISASISNAALSYFRGRFDVKGELVKELKRNIFVIKQREG